MPVTKVLDELAKELVLSGGNMDLSLAQLVLIIELTEKEIRSLKKVIDSPEATDNEADDSGELVMQYLALSSSWPLSTKSAGPANAACQSMTS